VCADSTGRMVQFSGPIAGRILPRSVVVSSRHKSALCKREATFIYCRSERRALVTRWLRKRTAHKPCVLNTSTALARALLLYYSAPRVGTCGKMAVLDHCDFEYKPVRFRLLTAHALNRCSSGIHPNRPVKRNPDSRKIKRSTHRELQRSVLSVWEDA
jgi:hypothetical protein